MGSESETVTIELWELAVAVTFFLVTLGGIFVFFDAQTYEVNLFIQDLDEAFLMMKDSSTKLTVEMPSFVEAELRNPSLIVISYNEASREVSYPENFDINIESSGEKNYLVIIS